MEKEITETYHFYIMVYDSVDRKKSDRTVIPSLNIYWRESKKRISQDHWLTAIQWIRGNGLTPNVRNDNKND